MSTDAASDVASLESIHIKSKANKYRQTELLANQLEKDILAILSMETITNNK